MLRLALGVLLLAIALLTVSPGVLVAQLPDAPPEKRSYMGRQIAQTMSAAGAEWLLRNTRQTEEQPQRLLAALDLRPGQQVCDFGCGNGFYTLKLAARVQPGGTVYAVDIQQEMLELLQQRAEPRGIRNIEPVLATASDPHLPIRQLDLVLMVDVYHELSHPDVVLQAVHQSLTPTGRLAIVEFRAEDRSVPIKPLHKMSLVQIMKEIPANGFRLVGQFEGLPWQHVLLFARKNSPLPPVELRRWQPPASELSPSPAPTANRAAPTRQDKAIDVP